MRGLMIGLMLTAAAVPAAAQDRTGYTAIAAGDFATAERTLMKERRIYPQRPELMLNLATVQVRMGRTADARSLYEAVLAAPDVALDLPDGRVGSSRSLARVALSRMTQAIAVR